MGGFLKVKIDHPIFDLGEKMRIEIYLLERVLESISGRTVQTKLSGER
jgi:hypothetical protein